MKTIYALLDYKNNFNSKAYAKPYRSGMDKELLKSYFKEHGYNLEYMRVCDINFRDKDFRGKYLLINSSEDYNLYYKDFIEDLLLGLMYQGAILLPSFKFFRAHSNKVFMEILRDLSDIKSTKNISSSYYGTLEELTENNLVNGEYVIKPAIGAVSRGVSLAKDRKDIIKKVKKISRSRNIFLELWDLGRRIKHKGYMRESKHRKKFILQNFIEELKNDWKILIYGNKYYVLFRKNRDNDFRASGSGKFKFQNELPDGILNFAKNIFLDFDVPNLSIDVAFNGNEFFLIEFQALYFGTTTIEKSPFYFIEDNSKWVLKNEKSILEKEYVRSIIQYIEKKYN